MHMLMEQDVSDRSAAGSATRRLRARRARFLTLVVLGGLLPGIAGCGPGLPPGKVRVSGRVTYKGKPLAADSVGFEAKDGSDSVVARADADGRFSVVLKPGDYHVAVRKLDGEITMDAQGAITYPPSLLPAKFASASGSGLAVTVAPAAAAIVIDIPE